MTEKSEKKEVREDILFLMYKIKHQIVPGYFENIVKRNDLKAYILRNSDFILLRYNTVKYGRHTLSDTWAHCYGPSWPALREMQQLWKTSNEC